MEDLKSLFVPISKDVLEDLVQKTKDWALMHGAGIRSRGNFSEDSLDFAPFILTPTPYPKEQFRKAEGLQTILNELMHRVAHDRLFLTKNLKDVIQVDEFTGNLFKIYETVCEEGFTQVSGCFCLIAQLFLFAKTVGVSMCVYRSLFYKIAFSPFHWVCCALTSC